MGAKLEIFHHGSKATRLVIMAVQSTALVAVWAIWDRAGLGLHALAIVYVLAVWTVAEWITLWLYVAFSLAPLSDLLAASLRTSASAMWLVPGALLLAARSPVAAAMGLWAVINSTRVLALSRAPKGETAARRRGSRESAHLLFRYQREYSSRERIPSILGALALQTGVYALAGEFPLLAAISFAAVTAIWMAMSVARGAIEARTTASVPYSVPGTLLTLLLTVTLTAALLHFEIVQERRVVEGNVLASEQTDGMTKRVLQRLAHVPPRPAAPSKGEAGAHKPVTRVVGVPGVVLRPRPKGSQRPAVIAPGARLRLSSQQALAIPFTGEYHLFRTSSGTLPRGRSWRPGRRWTVCTGRPTAGRWRR